MSNPALTSNPALNGKTLSAEELRRIYDQPAAQVERPGEASTQAPAAPVIMPSDDPMTMEDSIAKTAALFVTVVAFAAIGWMFLPQLMLPAAIVGLVLGLVNAFKKEPNVALIFICVAASAAGASRFCTPTPRAQRSSSNKFHRGAAARARSVPGRKECVILWH